MTAMFCLNFVFLVADTRGVQSGTPCLQSERPQEHDWSRGLSAANVAAGRVITTGCRPSGMPRWFRLTGINYRKWDSSRQVSISFYYRMIPVCWIRSETGRLRQEMETKGDSIEFKGSPTPIIRVPGEAHCRLWGWRTLGHRSLAAVLTAM